METSQWQSFSVFISSTFKDMHAERDYLNQFVFKELEEELEKHKVHFNIVDLRWGLNTKDIENDSEREKKIMDVLIDEISRCNPFFIAILGDRYGWQPPINRIRDFERKMENRGTLSQERNRKSVTHLEIEFGILQHYNLLSGCIACFRNLEGEIPDGILRTIYKEDENKAELLNQLKRKLIDHFEKYNEKLGDSNVIFEYDLIWNRPENTWNGIIEWGEKVKRAIRSCKKYKEITQSANELTWVQEEIGIFDGFIENHTREFIFIENGKSKSSPLFAGRDNIINSLLSFISDNSSNHQITILTGESGIGKSAILANLYLKLKQYHNFLILGHSSNLSPRSSQLNLLLLKWIYILIDKKENKTQSEKEILSKIKDQQFKFPNNFEEFCFLKDIFNELVRFDSSKKIVMFIDAIDYMENNDIINYFSWLNKDLPDTVRVICTTETLGRFSLGLYHKKEIFREMKVGGLTKKEAEQMIQNLCKLYNKQLPPSTLEKMVRKSIKSSTANPLWINMSLSFLLALNANDFYRIEMNKSHHKRDDDALFDYMEKRLDKLPSDSSKLFIRLLQIAKTIFGGKLVENVFNYLSISRFGLRENDLKCLLNRNWPKYDETDDHILDLWDDLQFASMRRWFKPFFIQAGYEKRWNVSHILLKNAILNRIEKSKIIEFNYDVIKYLIRKIYSDKKQYDDTLFQSETYYHLYQMDNQSMGIKIFDLFDDVTAKFAIEYIGTNFEDENFYHWFFSLFDFIATKKEETNEEKERMLCYITFNLVLEDIFKLLFFKGKYKLLFKALIDLNLKIEKFKDQFTIINLHQIQDKIILNYNVLNTKTGNTLTELILNNENLIHSEESISFIVSKFIITMKDLRSQSEFEIALKLFNDADKLLAKMDIELGMENAREYHQLYFETKGDYFFDYIGKKPNEFESYLIIVESCYRNFESISAELAKEKNGNIEFDARLGRSFQRMGNLLERYHIDDNQYVIRRILKYYQDEEHIFKNLYDYSPGNLSFKKGFSNSLSDLARINEKLGNNVESENFHIRNIDIYETINLYEEIIPEDIYYQCIAYENVAKFYYCQKYYIKSAVAYHKLINFIEKNLFKSQMVEELIHIKVESLNILNKIEKHS